MQTIHHCGLRVSFGYNRVRLTYSVTRRLASSVARLTRLLNPGSPAAKKELWELLWITGNIGKTGINGKIGSKGRIGKIASFRPVTYPSVMAYGFTAGSLFYCAKLLSQVKVCKGRFDLLWKTFPGNPPIFFLTPVAKKYRYPKKSFPQHPCIPCPVASVGNARKTRNPDSEASGQQLKGKELKS